MDRVGAVDGVVEHLWGGQVTNTQGFWIPSWGRRTLKLSPSWGASVSESVGPSPPRTPPEAVPIRVLYLGLGSRGGKGWGWS